MLTIVTEAVVRLDTGLIVTVHRVPRVDPAAVPVETRWWTRIFATSRSS